MSEWSWYLLGILGTYVIIQALDIAEYLNKVKDMRPTDRYYDDNKQTHLDKLKDDVGKLWFFAFIWPFTLIVLSVYYFTEIWKSLVEVIAKKLEK